MIPFCRRIVDASWFEDGVLAVFVVVNLFAATIVNNLEAVKGEMQADAAVRSGDAAGRLAAIPAQLEGIETVLRRDNPS